jgi:hypothetical protein
MKRQLLTLIAALALLMVAGSAFGQTINLRTTVPFDFVVPGKTLPAGEYAIRYDAAGTILSVQSIDTGYTTLIKVDNGIANLQPTAKPRLVFRHYGEVYFLRQVWQGGPQDGYELSKTKHEAELARKDSSNDRIVAATLR